MAGITAAIVLCLPLVAAGAEQSGTGTDTARTYEAFVDDVMADHFDRFELAGAVVAVVGDSEILMSKGYGHADLATEIPVEAGTTHFPTASVAKLFTWTAIMQLVEAGRLDLDADVNDYLTSFQIPDTFAEPVRVWHLLSHTAGFEDKPQVGAFSRSADDLPDLETALIDFMPDRVWEPGSYTAYSNYGSALAGHLVAEASGMAWDDYIEENIFGPLGMTRSSASQPISEALDADVTNVYVAGEEGLVEAMFEYSVLAPAGGIVTTGPGRRARVRGGRWCRPHDLRGRRQRRGHPHCVQRHPHDSLFTALRLLPRRMGRQPRAPYPPFGDLAVSDPVGADSVACRRTHSKATGGTTTRGARFARGWAAATAGMFLLFIVLVVMAVGDFTEIEYGVTPLLRAAIVVGGAAAVFTLRTIVHAFLAWRGGYWNVTSRVHYTLITLAFVALVWQMNHWNLLGLHV